MLSDYCYPAAVRKLQAHIVMNYRAYEDTMLAAIRVLVAILMLTVCIADTANAEQSQFSEEELSCRKQSGNDWEKLVDCALAETGRLNTRIYSAMQQLKQLSYTRPALFSGLQEDTGRLHSLVTTSCSERYNLFANDVGHTKTHYLSLECAVRLITARAVELETLVTAFREAKLLPPS